MVTGTVAFSRNKFEGLTNESSSAAVSPVDNKNRKRWKEVIKTIQGFRNLEEDWDTCGSIPPSRELIDSVISRALVFASNEFPAPMRVVATVNSEISFEWLSGITFRTMVFETPDVVQTREYTL